MKRLFFYPAFLCVCAIAVLITRDLAQRKPQMYWASPDERAHFAMAYLQEEMAWLNVADANRMADRDIALKRLRFFLVCGYSCQAVGIDSTLNQGCYHGITEQVISGTSDTTPPRLGAKAHKFAEQYNLRIAQYLDRHGGRSCGKGAAAGRAP